MSGALPHQGPIAPDALEDEQIGAVTRRTVLTGAAAATAAATVGAALDTPARAHSVDLNSREDMELFVLLSSALTGIPATKLAPSSDPVGVKREYLTRANERCPAALENLLRLVRKHRDASNREQAIIDALKFDDDDKSKTPSDVDAKYLARSIVLMWYLGAWYEPIELRALRKDLPKDPSRAPKFEVVSPKAYTQAWALRVAQAHPMGFSEMQFGYWTRPPNDLRDFI
jgi:Membrane bound FAD containing D-sorbitol dehydrogenase